MPIIWRFLLSQYLRVLILTVFTFLGLLLTTRLNEIAHFAALGTSWQNILWFTWHQIPYVLPIVLPVSCLISVMLLIQRLSRSHELTALRACGFGIRDILSPILLAAFLLSLANFILVSEVSTQSHLSSGLLKSQMRSMNPLLFLKNKHLRKVQGIHFEALGSSHLGESVHQAVIALPDKKNHRITLMMADKLTASPDLFEGNNVSVISCLNPGDGCDFDSLLIENSEQSVTKVSDFMDLFYKRQVKISHDELTLPLLLGSLVEVQRTAHSSNEDRNSIYSEILRRFSLALSVFTFTLMGATFGMSITRTRSIKGLSLVIIFATFTLIAYFTAKGLSTSIIATSTLYLAPHVVIIGTSIWILKRISRGIAI